MCTPVWTVVPERPADVPDLKGTLLKIFVLDWGGRLAVVGTWINRGAASVELQQQHGLASSQVESTWRETHASIAEKRNRK